MAASPCPIRRLEDAHVKDYDAIDGEGPLRWTASPFDVSNWALFTARVVGRLVGGATVGVQQLSQVEQMLETGRRDLLQCCGTFGLPRTLAARGLVLRSSRESKRGPRREVCRQLKVETQNINAARVQVLMHDTGANCRAIHHARVS